VLFVVADVPRLSEINSVTVTVTMPAALVVNAVGETGSLVNSVEGREEVELLER
jgi:hypothetical protein